MDLRSLTIFIQVAELNSFTRAGEKLGYSQPTVSFQIKQLEQELGVQLFERFGHNVTLTDDGRSALAYAQQICRLSQEMARDAGRETPGQGVVRLAMADSLCTPLVLQGFAALRTAHPGVSLKVMTGDTDALFRLLDHNEADAVCTLDSHIYNTAYVIAAEERMGVHFVCHPAHPLAGQRRVKLADLLPHPFLLTERGMSYRRLLDEELSRRSQEIHPVLEMGSTGLLCRLAEQGAGVSFLPDYVTRPAVAEGRLVRLETEDFQVDVWKQILYHRDKWISRPMQAVLEQLGKITLG